MKRHFIKKPVVATSSMLTDGRKSIAVKGSEDIDFEVYYEELWNAVVAHWEKDHPNMEFGGEFEGGTGCTDIYFNGFDDVEYYRIYEEEARAAAQELYNSGAKIDEAAILEIIGLGNWHDADEDDDYFDEDDDE